MAKSIDFEALGKYDDVRKLYFIASARTNGSKCLWGLVENGRMNLSSYGKIAERNIAVLNDVHDAICAEKYVVMPNHIHILFSVKKSGLLYMPSADELKGFICDIVEDYKSKTTADIMSFIASSVDLGIPREDGSLLWHDGCHIRGIHTIRDYERVTAHIEHNAQCWKTDRYYV